MVWPADKDDEVAISLRGRGKKGVKTRLTYIALLEMLRARKLID